LSYCEQDGQVVLTLSKEDFFKVLHAFAALTREFLARPGEVAEILAALNRLNEGNPQWEPYSVIGTSSAPPDSTTRRSRP
jgi:hypothetical protein